MTQRRYVAAVALLVAVFLGGCSSSSASEKPAECDSLAGVRQSVTELSQVQLNADGLTKLKNDVAQGKTEVTKLADQVSSQVRPQVDTLTAAVDQLSASVQQAAAAPSAATLQGVGSAVTATVNAAKSVGDALSNTC